MDRGISPDVIMVVFPATENAYPPISRQIVQKTGNSLPMPHDFILYGTSACHLCEQATEMLATLASHGLRWQEIDISNEDRLLTRYGTKIPVLRDISTGLELNWPFDRNDVISLLNSTTSQTSG